MSKSDWPETILCITVAAAYGAWRGSNLWSGPGVWCLTLPAVALGVQSIVNGLRSGAPWRVVAPVSGLLAVECAARMLAVALLMSQAAPRWSANASVRAMWGAAFALAGGSLAWYSAWRKERASKTPPQPGREESTLMPELESSHPADEPRPTSAWGWLKNPWLLLIFGGVISLGLWVGIGIWIESQRAAALAELKKSSPGIIEWNPHQTWGSSRCPIWLPEWIGYRLPKDWWRRLSISITDGWLFERSPTDHELRLFDQVTEIPSMRFRGPQAVSDEALLYLLERHPLQILEFYGSRKLTPQHYAALTRNENLHTLLGLLGPFDQSAVDRLEQITDLGYLGLNGPLEGSARFRSTPAGYITWDHSELNDDQFASFAMGSEACDLTLRQTRLTAKSWPAFERMRLNSLELESPHIDDALAHSLSRQRWLTKLCLRQGNLSDQGARELLALPELVDLEIEGRKFTIGMMRAMDEFYAEGKPSGPSRSLVIRGGSQVTDEWLAEVPDAEFEKLGFVNSAITDEGVEHLKNRKQLGHLALPGSRITDRSMLVFSTLEHLTSLDLRNTAITDAGLQQFSPAIDGWPTALHVGGTRITKQGIEEFLDRHPDIRVYGVDGIKNQGDFRDLIVLDDQSR